MCNALKRRYIGVLACCYTLCVLVLCHWQAVSQWVYLYCYIGSILVLEWYILIEETWAD